MPKQIMVTDDLYKLLEDLKEKTKSKSFTEVLAKLAEGKQDKDFLASRVSTAYQNLKEQVNKVDGMLVGVVERMGKISVNLAKTAVDVKAKKITLIEQMLDKVTKDILSEQPEKVKQPKKVEKGT